ncbi:hypothetical protein BJF79_03255 [Actinomadura sp. CNU-125]|uniref:hypothetical protein n=1 Tax=Actinomadura sp. CNU-125 TaxID=1904961 RepID=UPI000958FC94|nr:hypothetical protein [Actinomadura sp. CNU-125]OLT12930.1 hypothetical protein BJF79_03255 [Actinomadura sp. CNU-125]
MPARAASAVVQGTMTAMANASRNSADSIAPACETVAPSGEASSVARRVRRTSTLATATTPTAQAAAAK